VRHQRLNEANPSKAQRSAFDCGEPSLNRWLATQARQSMESRDAVTFLLLDEDRLDEPSIAGYYCLSAAEVSREAAPGAMGKRSPDPIPAVRMGRFAIDLRYQRQHWGAEMLREALLGAVTAGALIGARVMLVDAISEAALAFYSRYGFSRSPIHPMQVLYDLREVAASAGYDTPPS
jgi:ribosomal protein S18 acetylase RimI-like enzyme